MTAYQQQIPASLSPREREVLTLLATGLTKEEVGARLGTSYHTVKSQVCGVIERLEAPSLIGVYHRLGWLRVPEEAVHG